MKLVEAPTRLLLLIALACACGPTLVLDDVADGSTTREPGTSSSGGMQEPTTTAPGTTSSAGGTFGVDESDDGNDSSSFPTFTDGGHWCGPQSDSATALCCDVWTQDCPRSDKCTPWSNDGTGFWNSTRCAPMDPQPDPVGAPCLMEGDATSGIDSCERGAMCWNVDPETLEGVCVGFCGGTEISPICPLGSSCAIFNAGTLPLCLPECDPLGDDCEEGLACQSGGAAFVCLPTQAGGIIADGCEAQGGCPSGSVCATPQSARCPEGCCAPYCDTTDPAAHDDCSALGEGLVCVPWFEPGTAPPDHENVGVCGSA
jgi:hypothetical protein